MVEILSFFLGFLGVFRALVDRGGFFGGVFGCGGFSLGFGTLEGRVLGYL